MSAASIQKKKLMCGSIYDPNLGLLAMSVEVHNLYADPVEIADVGSAARQISKALGLNLQQLISQLSQAKTDGKTAI